MVVFELVSLLLSGVVLLPSAVLLTECGAALGTAQEALHDPDGLRSRDGSRLRASDVHSSIRLSVLMPAHNEEAGIANSLRSLVQEVDAPEQIVVVADNCTDRTADVARSFGVTVIERHDVSKLGKGYALDYGLAYLKTTQPDVVVVVDADCIAQAKSIQTIAQLAVQQNRPVQAVYLMDTPNNPSQRDLISALAFLFKNLVRPAGLAQLEFPCLLTGTGMAFPWSVISQMPLASGNLVEDMQLSMDLALAGHPPLFCPDAKITGRLPRQCNSAKMQRTRWEHGHLQTLKTQVPRLLQAALAQRRVDLLALALDLSIPPLALLVLFWVAAIAVALLVMGLGGSWLSLGLSLLAGAMLFTGVVLGWLRFGRSLVPFQSLLAIPAYVLWKVPLYFAFLFRRQTRWIRTERDVVSVAND